VNILSQIRLSKRYGKAIYVISAILTLAMSTLVIFQPVAIATCIILKLISIPIVLYLYTTLSKKVEMYFYLNLGISRNEYYIIPFVVEFIAFIILMLITGKIGYAIQ
jgi:hypothetical protein